ncbi:hypothetical protein SAVCW2_54290 [Streptomyces avermitilis]|nr:hypothetical protein SAVCW2_54290 [Streptomyces avermitilis]
MARSINLAVIPGDGIGQEVVAQGLKVLSAALPSDVKLETKEFDFGARRYHATGETLTDADLDALKQHDAILLGAIGDPSVPSGVLERGFLLKLRFAFDHHVNLRPSKLLPGVETPLAGQPEIDFVVVREGTEGPYTGNGGTIRTGTPHAVATEVSLNTAFGIERVVRDAYARAQARPARSWRSSTRTTCSCTPVTCGRTSSTRWARSSRTSPPSTCTWTRRPSTSSRSPSAST